MTRSVARSLAVAVSVFLPVAGCATQGAPSDQASSEDAPGPRLVVLIAVDQMRGDLLDRYASAYTGGFRRLLDQGHRFTEASHRHAHTETAAGHATISTGTFPSRSGIVANDWDERAGTDWTSMYALEDATAPIVGVPSMEGRSPRNMLRGGLADWVRAHEPEARVVSLSAKDRSAITMGGQGRGEVYWIAPALARFVTSTFYRTDYPGWVRRFNETRMPEIVADSVWDQTLSGPHRGLARPDSADYENDGIHVTFPHLLWEETDPASPEARNTWALNAQPRADRAVRLLAQEAVRELDLGQRGHVDYLGLSFSSTDYVGHAFGPFSQEQLENLMHLDREIGDLFAFLDREVGVGRWVVGLTADHGVMTSPEHLVATGEDPSARRLDPAEFSRGLREAAQSAVAAGGSEDEVAARLARLVEERGLVARAYTHRQLERGEDPDTFAVLFRNSYYPGRAAGTLSRFGVEIRVPFHTLTSRRRGTTHGTVYWYDRYVPFLLMGPGVRRGRTDTPVYTVDLAPTLARLAGVPVPGDLDGRPVY